MGLKTTFQKSGWFLSFNFMAMSVGFSQSTGHAIDGIA